MMGQAVEQGCGHLGVAEDGRPFAEGEVGGDDDRGALVEPAHEVEEQLPAGLGEGQVADDLVQAMGMSGISKSQVSRLCGEIDGKIQGFLERPLEGEWPYLWLDATYLKVREAGRIVSVAVTVAVAVNDQGRREVLGMAIGASEAETFWTEFLRGLARRGLSGVKLVIADDHTRPWRPMTRRRLAAFRPPAPAR